MSRDLAALAQKVKALLRDEALHDTGSYGRQKRIGEAHHALYSAATPLAALCVAALRLLDHDGAHGGMRCHAMGLCADARSLQDDFLRAGGELAEQLEGR